MLYWYFKYDDVIPNMVELMEDGFAIFFHDRSLMLKHHWSKIFDIKGDYAKQKRKLLFLSFNVNEAM